MLELMIDGKCYAFDFDAILKRCLGGTDGQTKKKKGDMRLVESEVIENYNGNERLSSDSRSVRELSIPNDNSQGEAISYDLFRYLSAPLLQGDFLVANGEPEKDSDGNEIPMSNVFITPAVTLSFNTMLSEGFLKEIESNEE